ncbi:calpastatin [Diaporthe helianthi]|uniref:Calpastatin n=1 Tax=Diaporthe helianthi TaxID=158607 RepID=A0A2P5HGF4_DIAHE|nr:calpastatin [Diaporthe helianthi]
MTKRKNTRISSTTRRVPEDQSPAPEALGNDSAGLDSTGHQEAAEVHCEPSAAITNEMPSSNQPLNNEATIITNPQMMAPPSDKPATQFPEFLQLPAELRLQIWEQAFMQEDFRFHAPFNRGSIQRFRFDLMYDRDRVKPGEDESRGWVACFTPLRINTRPYLKFLRVSYESREYMIRKGKISTLTVHALQHEDSGKPVGPPRKRHMPYHFGKDVFCIEGISNGLGWSRKCSPLKFRRMEGPGRFLTANHLADVLEIALGLLFAPRIKSLAIIPHHKDVAKHRLGQRFIEEKIGKDMATLAKRFPSLGMVRSATPNYGWTLDGDDRFMTVHFDWTSASLRGTRQGGPTKMSEEDRDELYRQAWFKILDATSAAKTTSDPYNLERFIKAQDQGNAFNEILAAFSGGHRKPHPSTWMWFVFPQMNNCQTRSLRDRISSDGISYEESDERKWRRRDVWPKNQALTSLDEARAYLRHPILGDRVRQAARVVLESPFVDKFALMDNISMDVARLHSSMTIFRQATRFPTCIHDRKEDQAGDNRVFAQVLRRFFVRFSDSDEEADWEDSAGNKARPPKLGSRHKPTLACLETLEQVDIARREKEGAGCVCGHGKEQIEEMDRVSKRKMDDSRVAMEAEKKRKRQRKEQKRKEQEKALVDNSSTEAKATTSAKNDQVLNT